MAIPMRRGRFSPDPPEDLDDVAKEQWRTLITDLVEPGAGELSVLRVACEAWSTRARALEAVNAEGFTVANARGQTKINPALGIAREQTYVYLAALKRLGIDSLEPE